MPPLPTLLSQVLVAFTIEFDNEAERRLPHTTTNHGPTAGALPGPWLVSMAMWWNCMRFVGDEGLTASKLEDLARTPTNLNGMERWGYIVVAPDPADRRPKPPRSAWLIRATLAGRMAQEVWRPLFGEVEERWRARFGEEAMDKLRESLWAVVRQFEIDLPDCLPILGYGLFSQGPKRDQPAHVEPDLPLPALLSKVLLAFAMEFEHASPLSLAICANVLRVLDEDGVRVRDVPVLSGVSKESIKMAIGFLQKGGLVDVDANVVGLTPKGLAAQEAYALWLEALERRWQARFGEETIRALHESLEGLVGERLWLGLEPYPNGWRAKVRKPTTLPHYPMVLHRGGYPDGS